MQRHEHSRAPNPVEVFAPALQRFHAPAEAPVKRCRGSAYPSTRSLRDDAVLDRVPRQLSSGPEAELIHNRRFVKFHCLH